MSTNETVVTVGAKNATNFLISFMIVVDCKTLTGLLFLFTADGTATTLALQE